MGKKTVRSGIVGAGFAGTFHFNGLGGVRDTDVQFQGVFDLDRTQREAFAKTHEVPVFDELEALLDAVDVVHVCTPAAAHEAVAVAALERGKFAIVEKPLTGYFGDGSETFNGDTFPKEDALRGGMASVKRLLEAEAASAGCILYAENWVYAPAIQKEREIIEKTGAQCLWILGQQAHSGSHAPSYAHWRQSGGGVTIGKGCHPLSATLYLKRKEGMARDGRPIRPRSVSSRVHALTRMPGFIDQGHIRSNYHDIDDFSMMHLTFEDGTVATIVSSDILLGGVQNRLDVCANNHRTVCNINPNSAMETYNPVDANFADIYTVEKIGTKQGWSNPSPAEDFFNGYPQEIEAFYRTVAYGDPVESDSGLAADSIAAIYCAYVSNERGGAEVEIETR